MEILLLLTKLEKNGLRGYPGLEHRGPQRQVHVAGILKTWEQHTNQLLRKAIMGSMRDARSAGK